MTVRKDDLLDDVLSVAETADELDVPDEAVRELLRDGVIRGRKLGSQWIVDGNSVDAVRSELLQAELDVIDDDFGDDDIDEGDEF